MVRNLSSNWQGKAVGEVVCREMNHDLVALVLLQNRCTIQGGKPSTKEARVAHSAVKPDCRAMPTRLTNLLVLQYCQSELLTALVEVK